MGLKDELSEKNSNITNGEIFFVDKDGNKISNENIGSHIGLAFAMLEEDETLKKEFMESKKRNPAEFLIANKGYMTVNNIGEYKTVVFTSSSISDKQQRLLTYYHEEGYELNDQSQIEINSKEK